MRCPEPHRTESLYPRLARYLGLLIALVACLVLAGWLWDIPQLRNPLPGTVDMKANTALAFLALGIAVALAPAEASGWQRGVAQGLSVLVVLFGFATVLQYLFDLDFRLDQAIIAEPTGAIQTVHLGRPAPVTAINFIMFGTALLLLGIPGRPSLRAQHLALLAGADSLLAVFGYIYGVHTLFNFFPAFTGIAFLTAALFVILTAAILAARPDQGVMALVTSSGASGTLVRRMLPAAILAPLAVELLANIGKWRHFYGTDTEEALHSLLVAALLVFICLKTAHLLDDTERKQRRAEDSLRAAGLYTRSLIEASADPLMAIDLDGTVSDVNKAAEAATGRPRAQLLGSDFARHFDDPDQGRAMFHQALQSGAAINFPQALRHADGTTTDVLCNATLYRGRNDTVEGVFAAARDITELKRAEERLKEMARDIERSNRELEQFAHIAAHDLQEPLRMVTSYVQLLKRRYAPQLDSEAMEFIDFAVDGAKRMSNQIRDLLDYSRIGDKGAAFMPVACAEMAALALANLSLALEEAKAVVTVGELPRVIGDPVQIVSLFQNLIANAIKYRSPDRPPHVAITAEPDGDFWMIRIADNGIGINPQYCERIFLIFQRLHRGDSREGTGIGLAACRRMVERHGGRIGVDSVPGEGSTFWFSLKGV